MNIELIKVLLIIASASSILSSAFMQKIKTISLIKCSSCLIYISFLVSMLFGILFTLTFTEYNIVYSLWVGLFGFLEADTLYKTFENKVFSSYSEIKSITSINRDE